MKEATDQAIYVVKNLERVLTLDEKDREKGTKRVAGWADIAKYFAEEIKQNYKDSESSQISAKKRLKRALKGFNRNWLQEPDNYDRVKFLIEQFGQKLDDLFYLTQKKVNERYRDTVSKRSDVEKHIDCNLTPWLIKAYQVLEGIRLGRNIFTTPYGNTVLRLDGVEYSWASVSCALALVTGRRQSEIHLSGTFKPKDRYEILFKGQLKGKDREKTDINERLIDREYTFPTLVPTDLVVSGVEFLELTDKRLDPSIYNPEDVNQKFSKKLAQEARKWEIIPDSAWSEFDKNDRWTYHKFRCVYYAASLKNYIDEGFDYFTVQDLSQRTS